MKQHLQRSLQRDREIKSEAKLENLEKIIEFINTELDEYGFPLCFLNDINLIAEEIFTNIVYYAYAPGNGSVLIVISVTDKIILKFEDTGKPYNPLLQPDPDLEISMENRDIGGLGIFIVKKLADSIEYSRIDNRNILTVSKNLP